ncbi:uncharacterized protein LOC128552315 [Mercenaria mercenaria]|uniref:uncharacterized protein LOC128552315 n=1 Tax=Mercenaria mercenaria TaxID=6596 RepID=UPI00234E9B3E|nr:uncharacterized protein LOC128552315 [Mercenaria mercenaria]
MPFGISPAPEYFQQFLEQNLTGLSGIKAIADDIIIYGKGETYEEALRDHDNNMQNILERCQERGIKLNMDKFQLHKTEMQSVGHLLTDKGVQADPSKIEAITKMPKPTDKKAVQRLLGLLNYLAKFLDKLSQMCEPLRQLTRKDVVFNWRHEHDEAFDTIKQSVCNAAVFCYYDSKLETSLHSCATHVEEVLLTDYEKEIESTCLSDYLAVSSGRQTRIKQATLEDKTLVKLIECIKNGWNKAPREVKPYYSVRDELSVDNDYFSNFFEIDRLYETTSKEIVAKLKQHFARHGIPERVISDNASVYKSEKFKSFSRKWDFTHVTSSARYPRSNGKAENAVKTAKCIMKKAKHSHTDPMLALLNFRNTPQQATSYSPAQQLMNRKTRTLLPERSNQFQSSIPSNVKAKLQKRKDRQAYYYNRNAKPLDCLRAGDTGRKQPNERNKTWEKGTVVEKPQTRSYNVLRENGTVVNRNRKHLRRTSELFNEQREETVDIDPKINDQELLLKTDS